MTYRIPRADLIMAEAMPFQQHWEARVPVPIDKLGDLGLAFHNAFSSIRLGDRIDVCFFEQMKVVSGETEGVMRETATFRVTSRDLEKSRMEVVQIGETFKIAPPKVLKPNTPRVEMHKVKVAEKAWDIRDNLGNVIEQVGSAAQASEFIRSQIGGVEVDPPKAKAA